MLAVEEAIRAIADSMPVWPAESVRLDQACGRVLRQSVVAERDQPPFDRVTMDGIAIAHDAFVRGSRRFRVAATQHAGDPVTPLANGDDCVEIMTGAVLPVGADCVIPVERIEIDDGVATLEAGYEPERHQFVHPRGSDYEKGHEILRAGGVLSPMDVAIVASCGLATVDVNRQPVIRVISTGNELVAPGLPIADHQVRLSNGPALVAMLTGQGFADAAHEHLVDDPAVLEGRLGQLLDTSDVLILSGGVSMGKADYVPEVLKSLGVELIFHKIRQRPGKPMWYGKGPADQAVFALPGNPVSTLVCCRHYVLPALYAAGGRTPGKVDNARLASDVTFKAELTCFMPVRLSPSADGVSLATPVPTNTSGDFAALTGTDGYVELAREETEFPAGTILPLHRWATP